MRFIDDMPIFVIIIALIANIAIGVSVGISFSALMVRCIVVIIVFGLLGYAASEIIRNAILSSKVAINNEKKASKTKQSGAKIDIKVPPIEDSELMGLEPEADDGFVEMNPAYMNKYGRE